MSDYDDWRDAADAGDYRAALKLVEYPAHNRLLPLVEELTTDQRALVEHLAASDFDVYQLSAWALPKRLHSVRRWLGHSPPGVLERELTYEHKGDVLTEPIWRAMLRKQKPVGGNDRFFHELDLTFAERLEVFADIYFGAFRLKRNRLTWGSRAQMSGDHGDWARRTAERAIEGGYGTLSMELKWAAFLGLVRAGIPIEPRWDILLPAGYGPELELMRECVQAIPQDRRDDALVRAVRALSFGSSIVRCGLAMLHDFPSRALTQLVLNNADAATTGTEKLTKAETLERLEAAAKVHDVVGRTVRAHRDGIVVPDLRCVALVVPKTADELTATQCAQIVQAGVGYDGREQTIEQRLSDAPELEESSFLGSLELRVFADPTGAPLYDAYSYAGDSGSIFEHGTLNEVGQVIQGGLQCADSGLREALIDQLYADPS